MENKYQDLLISLGRLSHCKEWYVPLLIRDIIRLSMDIQINIDSIYSIISFLDGDVVDPKSIYKAYSPFLFERRGEIVLEWRVKGGIYQKSF
jgi:hypothetical protein